jgi:hypothetical protein
MANRFWVTTGTTGGTGNWSDTQNWATSSGGTAGASVPGAADGARYDGNSGTGTATLDISPTVQSLSFAPTTSFDGTFAFGTNTVTLNSTGTVFVGSTSMTVTGTPQVILTETTPSATARTISPGAVTEANSISFRITGSTGALTLSTGSYLDLDFTDGTNPTGYGGALGGNSPTVYGSFKASTNMTQTSTNNAVTFSATSGTKTITTAAVVFNRPFTFNGVGGSWQLQDALTSGATRTCTLTNGTLNLNNFTLTIGIFSSNNANVRALSFGTLGGGGSLDITSASTTADVTVFNASNSTNFTADRNGNINIIGAPTGFIRSITPGLVSSGGTAANSLNFTILDGSDTINLGTDNHVYNNIEINGFTGSIGANVAPYIYGGFNNQTATITGGANAWVFAGTSFFNSFISNSNINNPVIFDGIGGGWEIYNGFTINAALTLINGTLKIQNGTTLTVASFVTSGTNQKFLSSTSPGTQATISAASGTNSVSYLTIQDSNATGGAEWDAYTGNFNVNAGNNTGWNFSQFGNKYIYTRRKLKRIIF